MMACRNLTRLILKTNHFMCFRLLASSVVYKELSIDSAERMGWDLALSYKTIPGPGKLENLRNFLPGGKFYNKSRYDVTKMLHNQYGEIVKMPNFFQPKDYLLVFNPNYFEKIYRNDGIWPIREDLETLEYYRNELRPEIFKETGTLLTSNGEQWDKLRSKVNPVLMQPKSVKMYVPKIDKTTIKFIDRMRRIRDPITNELPGNFEGEINRWALEQICLVGLDTELGLIGNEYMNVDADKLISAVKTISEKTDKLEFELSVWKYIKTPIYKKLIKAYDTLTDISLKYIGEAIERYRLNENNDSYNNEKEKSIVERLNKIDKSVAVVIAMEMFLAGVDTTTTALTGCILSLAKNPDKQEKLRDEIRKVFPDRDSPMTSKILEKLPYLRAVIKEALRKYPVIHDFVRNTSVDFVLGKYQIPKYTDIIMLGTHSYDKNEHFSDADKFIPERWIRNENEGEIESSANLSSNCPVRVTKPSNPFVFLPFGFGPRMCAGKRLVSMELEILLIRMIQNFHVEYNYDDKDMFALKLNFTPDKELKFKLTEI